MKSKLVATVLTVTIALSTISASAQRDQFVLMKHPAVAKVVDAIELRKIGCDSAEIKVRLGSRSLPSTDPLMVEARRALTACVDGPSSSEQDDIKAGLGYLDSKPAARTALRTYFLAWGQFLRALGGDFGSAYSATAGKNIAAKRMDDALSELTLELSL